MGKIFVQRKPSPTLVRRCKRKNHVPKTLSDLPNEILLDIFSMLSPDIILSTITQTCTRWNQLTKYSFFWKNMHLDEKMSKEMISKWLINMSPQLKQLVVKNRTDLDDILGQIASSCKVLEKLEICNCRGSLSWINVRSLPMCNIIRKCPKLEFIHLHKTRFTATKFYQLMANKAKREKPFTYVGPTNSRQLNVFLKSIKESNLDEESVLVGNGQALFPLKQLEGQFAVSMEQQQISLAQAILNNF